MKLAVCTKMVLLLMAFYMSNAQDIAIANKYHLYLPEKALQELFTDVQLAKVFKDSKTFADCIPLQNPEAILKVYRQQKNTTGFSLPDFVQLHFRQPATEGQQAVDADTNMISHLKQHWPVLTRQTGPQEAYSSLVYLPHPFIVPGGRFRELFYWDSYFTIIGLLESGEDTLALGMIQNFDYLINTYGFIPNGNRTYFFNRSQPPFFAEMLKAYAAKHGRETVLRFMPALEKEYHFWMKDRANVNATHPAEGNSVWVNGFVLNRYCGTVSEPRSEAWNKEYTWAQALPSADRPTFYLNLRAACESGWDFSSRWFADGKNRNTIQTENLVPVCLNSLLFEYEQQLAEYYESKRDMAKAEMYQQAAVARKAAILKYCWQEEKGVFNDYQFISHQHSPVISLAMVYPLYVGIASQQQADKVATVIAETFLAAGGLVTTPVNSGEQWDSPNGWAPLQWLAVGALQRYGYTQLAATIARRWLAINESVFRKEHKMMEKYNVINPDLPGGGGNYENQDGFGWTNGVALALDAWLKTVTLQ